MRIIAIEHETPGLTAADYRPHLRAEAGRAWELYCSGMLREMYFTQDDHRAVLVLECSGREEAAAALSTLPLVEAGLIQFELLPLQPYDGFARLFDQQGQAV
jgi:hypothetical protein